MSREDTMRQLEGIDCYNITVLLILDGDDLGDAVTLLDYRLLIESMIRDLEMLYR